MIFHQHKGLQEHEEWIAGGQLAGRGEVGNPGEAGAVVMGEVDGVQEAWEANSAGLGGRQDVGRVKGRF